MLKNKFFAGILKVSDENSRIRIGSSSQRRGSGSESTPKCHGSATMVFSLCYGREKCSGRAFSRFDTSSGFLLESNASFTLAAGPGCGSGSVRWWRFERFQLLWSHPVNLTIFIWILPVCKVRSGSGLLCFGRPWMSPDLNGFFYCSAGIDCANFKLHTIFPKIGLWMVRGDNVPNVWPIFISTGYRGGEPRVPPQNHWTLWWHHQQTPQRFECLLELFSTVQKVLHDDAVPLFIGLSGSCYNLLI